MRGHGRRSERTCLLGLCFALAACAGTSQPSGRAEIEGEGWDEGAAQSVTPPSPPNRPLPDFDELLSWSELGRVTTAHPGSARRAVLRASPEAADYGRRGRQPFVPDATLVASLHSSDGAAALTHYVMRKREPGYFPEGGDWEYAVVSPEGKLLAEGRLALCARCHAEATREHVFEPLQPSPPDEAR